MKNYEKRYILLKGFLRWKQDILSKIIRYGYSKKQFRVNNKCFFDVVYEKIDHQGIKESVFYLILLREELAQRWIVLIQKDIHVFNRLDPSGVAASKAWDKLRQAIDAFGGFSTDGEGSIRWLETRINKDMQRIRNRIMIAIYIRSRKDSLESSSGSYVSDEQVLVDYTTPEDILIAKEEGNFW